MADDKSHGIHAGSCCFRRLIQYKRFTLLGFLICLIVYIIQSNMFKPLTYNFRSIYQSDSQSGNVYRTMEHSSQTKMCKMETCFDYSKCPLVRGFPVYVYKLGQNFSNENLNQFVKFSVSSAFSDSPYVTYHPGKACIFIAVFGEPVEEITSVTLQNKINSLEHWNGDGKNHILLDITRTASHSDLFKGVNTGMAIIAQSAFTDTHYRRNFDIVIPPNLGNAYGQVWSELPPLFPVRRTFLLSFSGHLKNHTNIKTTEFSKQSTINTSIWRASDDPEKSLTLESKFIGGLERIQRETKVNITLNCEQGHSEGMTGEWNLCDTDSERKKMLLQSTFNIIPSPVKHNLASTTTFQTRLYEALKHGTIPVILGDAELPYSELLDWNKAVIFIPKARVIELYSMLGTFNDNDLAEYKGQGRLFWETYFGTTHSIIATFLSVLRTRLQFPAVVVREEPSVNIIKKVIPVPQNGKTSDVLGPVEAPFPSVKFTTNFTILRDVFNKPGDPFHLFPHNPFIKVLSSDAKFKGSGDGFQHINKGLGGTGESFRASLGGNYPKEQFTVVMPTYKRSTGVFMRRLKLLIGLPFLNKVLVIWNNPDPPSEDLDWPDIGVPVVVIKAKRNSLNNRFLPYEAIETEAIFSMDDDWEIRHDELVFGFRVWREERDRIVGIPGRHHGWDENLKRWKYMFLPACEVSLVLTGAAFFHKHYAYLYSYSMPQAIRDKVDEYMNCEDIAMNFLVSHITRKPPLKVSSRLNSQCKDCGKLGLAGDSSHYSERMNCINFFSEVYGYTPLLYSQYRADSVLYNTGISEQKACFRNV